MHGRIVGMNVMDKKLNKEQLQAVKHKKGPLLIIAGAGTGKTTVVTERIKYLIEKGLAKPSEILALMGRVGDVQWESIFGTTFPGYYALYANRHMHDFGTTKEQIAQVAVKNHYYGSLNPNAFFQKEVTMERILGSDDVAYPLKVFDCCANADGAACVIIASEDIAKKASKPVAWLDGMGCALNLNRSHLKSSQPPTEAVLCQIQNLRFTHATRTGARSSIADG